MSKDTRFQDIKEKLLKNDIFIRKLHSSGNKPEIVIVKTDSESTTYEVTIGLYSMFVHMLAMDLSYNFCNDKEILFKGGKGSIFFTEFKGEKYAAKFVHFEKMSEYILTKLLTEIFFSKFVSALEIGPTFEPLYGYDCILFSDGMEFLMEKCENNFDYFIAKSAVDNQQIFKSLQTLHFLHICHCDMKPGNIVWSNKKKKMVLIDFGFTQFVKENRN